MTSTSFIRWTWRKPKTKQQIQPQKVSDCKRLECHRCGHNKWQHWHLRKCPAIGTRCFRCGKFGHYARKCLSRLTKRKTNRTSRKERNCSRMDNYNNRKAVCSLLPYNKLDDLDLKKAAPAVKVNKQETIKITQEFQKVTSLYKNALEEMQQDKEEKIKVFMTCMDMVEQAMDAAEDAKRLCTGQAKKTLKTRVNKIDRLLRDIFNNRMFFKNVNLLNDEIPKVLAQCDLPEEEINRFNRRKTKYFDTTKEYTFGTIYYD
ncbi:hypothetical protein DPMN_037348 [Dreissena polymorpha]|uniref:CCHC-type domain-containing protein n=1 Tax=Dreissena polymorpha TaxID=45954 RepID=A0A9D4MEV0_DREPO|nr:hypothetical protein DPMN_037348 [Dreissena polymorpha]